MPALTVTVWVEACRWTRGCANALKESGGRPELAEDMDLTDRSAWTRFRSGTGWTRRAWELGQELRPASESAGQLYVVGTPQNDAWHVAAHLDDEARFTGLTTLRPRLLRWRPPADGPAHLRLSIDELRDGGHGRAVLVVAPDPLAADELERLADARRAGATLLAVTTSGDELAGIAHESAVVDSPVSPSGLEDVGFAGHVVTVSAGTALRPRRRFALLSR
jgi:hypothetical protein